MNNLLCLLNSLQGLACGKSNRLEKIIADYCRGASSIGTTLMLEGEFVISNAWV